MKQKPVANGPHRDTIVGKQSCASLLAERRLGVGGAQHAIQPTQVDKPFMLSLGLVRLMLQAPPCPICSRHGNAVLPSGTFWMGLQFLADLAEGPRCIRLQPDCHHDIIFSLSDAVDIVVQARSGTAGLA